MNNSRDKALKSWEKLTNPKKISQNLLLASLYLSAYEILMNSVIDQLRNFYFMPDRADIIEVEDNPCGRPIEKKRHVLNDNYRDEVKNLHKPSILCASCLWLENIGAITKEDVNEIDEIRRHRNSIAHKLPDFLGDIDLEINSEHLKSIRRLLQKIDIWWIKEVWIPVDSDFDGVEVKEEEIQSGSVILLDLILQSVTEYVDEKVSS